MYWADDFVSSSSYSLFSEPGRGEVPGREAEFHLEGLCLRSCSGPVGWSLNFLSALSVSGRAQIAPPNRRRELNVVVR